jgi:hypothetical protein
MAEELRFGIIAVDQASAPLGDVSAAAERTAAAMRGPASSAATAYADTLGQLERTLGDVRQTTDQTGATVEDNAGEFRQGETAAAQFESALRDKLLQTFDRLGTSINTLIDSQQQQERQTKQSEGATSRWAATLTGLYSGVQLIKEGLTALVSATSAFFASTTENTAAIDRFATRVGISAQEMSVLQFAASTIGLELDDVGEALATVQENMSEFARLGSGPAAEAIRVLGLTLTDTQGRMRSLEDLLPEIADGFAQIQDPADRLRLAIQLFGEEDSRLLGILAEGGAGLDAYRTRAEQLGVVVSGPLLQQSKQFQIGLTEVSASLRGVGLQIVEAVLPSLNAIIPRVTSFIAAFRQSDILNTQVIPYLQGVATWALNAIGNFDSWIPTITQVAQTLVRQFETAIFVLSRVAEGWGHISTGIQTASTWVQGFVSSLGIFETANSAVKSATEDVGFLTRAWEIVNAAFSIAIGGIYEGFRVLRQAIASTFSALASAADWVPGLGRIADGFRTIATNAQGFADEQARIRDAAFETAAAWIDGNMRVKKSQAEVTGATEGTTAAVDAEAAAYGALGAAIEEAQKKQAAAAAAGQLGAKQVAQAYETLGIQSTQALQDATNAQIRAFATLVQSGNESTARLQTIWEDLVPKIQEAYGKVPPTFAGVHALLRQDTTETVAFIDGAWRNTSAAIGATAQETVALLSVAEAEKRQAAINANAAIVQNTVIAYDAVRGVYADTGTAAIASHESIVDSILNLAEQTTAASAATAEAVSTDYETISGRFQNVTDFMLADWEATHGAIAREAEDSVRFIENKWGELVPVVVDQFGNIRRAGEAAFQGIDQAAQQTTFLLGNELVGGIRQVENALGQLATETVNRFGQVISTIEASGRATNALVQGQLTATAQIFGTQIDPIFRSFGSTVEELRAQIGGYTRELLTMSILTDQAGISTGAYSARKAFLVEIVGDLTKRMRELEGTQDDYTGSVVESTQATRVLEQVYESVGRSAGRVAAESMGLSSALRQARGEVESLRQSQVGATQSAVQHAQALGQVTTQINAMAAAAGAASRGPATGRGGGSVGGSGGGLGGLPDVNVTINNTPVTVEVRGRSDAEQLEWIREQARQGNL